MFQLVVLFSVVALAAAKPSSVPVAYSASPAVSSVSQYSSSVVHGVPAVYSAPAVIGAPAVYAAPALYNAPVYGYSALSQASHSPAVVLDAVNGVPLDTPEVVAARAANYEAKALSGVHHISKRAVSVAPQTYSSVVSPGAYSAYSSPGISSYSSPAFSAYSTPYESSYTSPYGSAKVVYKTHSVHQ